MKLEYFIIQCAVSIQLNDAMNATRITFFNHKEKEEGIRTSQGKKTILRAPLIFKRTFKKNMSHFLV